MSRGTTQDERLPAGLEPGHVRVDEFRFEQLAAMTAGLAQRLRFYDVDLSEAGHWGELFATDETLVLARLVATDRLALQARFTAFAGWAPPARLAHEVLRLAQWLDLTFKSLAASPMPAAHALRERLAQLVRHELAEPVQWVYERFGTQVWDGRTLAQGRDRLDPVWTPAETSRAPAADESSEREHLRRSFSSLASTLARAQQLAQELLPQTLATPTHDPAAGLLIAFLQVYGSVQQEINRFTDAHVDFYYRRVLGLAPAASTPDFVHAVARREARGRGEVELPAGLALRAGKDGAGRPVLLRTRDALTVTPLRVEQLLMLRLEHDPLISPEREFGFVTRVKATRIPAPAPEDTPLSAWPLLGGSRAGAAPAAQDARLGMAVASPLLLLAEGEREITLRLSFAAAGADFAQRLETALAADDATAFFAALGPLLRAWLFADTDPLDAAQLAALRAHAGRLLGADSPSPPDVGDPLGLLSAAAAGPPARELVFDRLLNGLFEVSLTGPDGWIDVPLHVRRAPATPGAAGGIVVAIRLRPEDPPVVGCSAARHGAEWPTRLPLLQLRLGTGGRLHGYSLFCDLPLAEAGLAVRVRGLRRIAAFNQLGRLDAGKPFAPFGPLPTLSSYLVFGAEELARKPVRELSLRLLWGGLPAAGFGAHYAGYRDGVGTRPFTATMSALSEGQWLPVASQPLPLFATDPDTSLPRAGQTLSAEPAALVRHLRNEGRFADFEAGARDGYYRLQLSGPPGAFGHAQHATLLAQAIGASARRKRPLPMPEPPYTPLLEGLRLDYAAEAVMRPRARTEGAQGPEDAVLLHVHPFGITELVALTAQGRAGLLPQAQYPASLYIGLGGGTPVGPLSLLFHLCEERAAEDAAPPRYEWALLADDRWMPLPAQAVMADETDGFLSTGIVRLDLPEGATDRNTILPAGLHWLRLSTHAAQASPAALYGVHAHGLVAQREPGSGDLATPLAPGAVEGPTRTVAGLAGVTQVGASRGLRPAEDTRQFRARVGERLRHRDRASLAWDAERLLLERFPEIGQVRCFSAQELPAEAGLQPGEVLAVVVPALPRNRSELATAAPRVHAGRLRRMQAWLCERASPFASIVVRNAAYERVQVRCCVQAARGATPGQALRRVERAIVEHLSPWFDGGRPAQFGWTLSAEEVEGRLRELPEVDAVGALSLLHVATGADGRRYTLGDTARVGGREDRELRARLPWSLALPMRHHMLTLAGDTASAAPQPTGVSRLAVGSTFIVARSAP